MTRIPFILLSTTDGSPLTGATPSVTISKDGGTFASATNNPAEIGNGYYYVDLTTAETTVNNNVIIRMVANASFATLYVRQGMRCRVYYSTGTPQFLFVALV